MKNLFTRLSVLLIAFAVAGVSFYSCAKDETPDPTQKRIAELRAEIAILADEVRAAIEPAKTDPRDISGAFNFVFKNTLESRKDNSFYDYQGNLTDSTRVLVLVIDAFRCEYGHEINAETFKILYDKCIAYLIAVTELDLLVNSVQEIGGTTGQLTWVIGADKTLVIGGTGAMPDYDPYAPWIIYNYLWDKVIFGEGVTSIGKYAFFACSTLTEISIPNTVTDIGEYAFSGCYNLKNITLPSGLQSLESRTFEYCWGLNSITIPEGVTKIGDRCFYTSYATSETFKEITILATTPPELGTGNFERNADDTLYVPAGSLEAYRNDPDWSAAFTTITTIPL